MDHLDTLTTLTTLTTLIALTILTTLTTLILTPCLEQLVAKKLVRNKTDKRDAQAELK